MARAQQVRRALPESDRIDTARLGQRFSDMSPATRQRVVDQMGSLKQSTRDYIAETDVEAPGAKTAKLIEVTGSGGKRALRALADGNRRAADALLRMADDAATQRAMVRAWENGDVSTKELATALRQYNELDASERAEFRKMSAATGDDGVEFMANAKGQTVRVALDGSGDVDESFRRALARAADSDAVDSYAQLDRAVRKIDELEGERKRRAKQLIADTDGAGVRFVDEFDKKQLRSLSDEIEDGTVSQREVAVFVRGIQGRETLETLNRGVLNDYEVSDLAAFIHQTDGHSSDLVNDLDAGRIRQALELDKVGQRRLANVAYEGSISGDRSLASDDITPEEFLQHINDRNIDPENIRMIAKSDGAIISLLPGDSDFGLQHLLERHFRGSTVNTNADETRFFPSGSEAASRSTGPAADLPAKMDRNELAPLLRKTIEEGSHDGGTYTAEFDSPRHGIKKVQVNTESGKIATAYPLAGPEVKRWNWKTGQWEERTGSGWQRWNEPYQ
ncbi:hypothetical protein [Halomicrobium salinisoli]|uniref:hypothetical protein n=1 Tax=Halomicrobium salinisoli TaxID=2878391 RepID=UPI001CF08EFF|nr:hypothetical protein [Halomicrobium salinisoli]